MRIPKVPDHETLSAQHISLFTKVKFVQSPRGRNWLPWHLDVCRKQPWYVRKLLVLRLVFNVIVQWALWMTARQLANGCAGVVRLATFKKKVFFKIFCILPYKLLIWAGPITHYGQWRCKLSLKACWWLLSLLFKFDLFHITTIDGGVGHMGHFVCVSKSLVGFSEQNQDVYLDSADESVHTFGHKIAVITLCLPRIDQEREIHSWSIPSRKSVWYTEYSVWVQFIHKLTFDLTQ